MGNVKKLNKSITFGWRVNWLNAPVAPSDDTPSSRSHLMKRRAFLLSTASLLLAPSASAQPARKPVRIGVLSSAAPEARQHFWAKFKEGMASHGWVEGRDLAYSYRYSHGDPSRFDALAKELVAEKPDLVFAGTQLAALAAKRATATIPIVFAYVTDPVGSGLVASLARPGGNVTGLGNLSIDIVTKHLDLLKDLKPRLRMVTILTSPSTTGKAQAELARTAARAIGVEVQSVPLLAAETDRALDAVAKNPGDGVIFYATSLMERSKVADRMAKLRVPAIYPISELVVAGGLISYGAEIGDNYRRAAEYADKILKGAKPADLPVQQPQAFELVVNLKTAREQGIAIPQSILLRATKIVE